MLLGTRNRLMRRASGTKPVARFREGMVPTALQNLHHCLLDQSIQHGWNAKLPHPSVRLRDFHPTYRLRLISPTQQLFPDGYPVLLQVVRKVINRHSIDARTASVSFHTLVCLPEIFSLTDLLHPLLIRSQAFCTALRHGCFGPFIGRVPGFTRQPFPEGQLKLVLLPLCTFESCHVLASPIVQAFVHRSRLSLAVDSAFRPWSASLALPTTWATMPFADFYCTVKKNRSLSSRESTTCNRSPVVSSIAFSAPPPDLPALAFDGYGLCCSLPTRPRVLASYPVLVHRRTPLLHASFRPHLAMTPLRFANPSPPSGWNGDLPPTSYRTCTAHNDG